MKKYLFLILPCLISSALAANCPDPTKGEITATFNSGKTTINGSNGGVNYSTIWPGNLSDVTKMKKLGVFISNAIIDSSTTTGKTYFSINNVQCSYSYNKQQFSLFPQSTSNNYGLMTVFSVNQNLSTASTSSSPWGTSSIGNQPHFYICYSGSGCSFNLSTSQYNQP